MVGRMTQGPADRGLDVLRSLLRATHHLPADRLGSVVAEQARGLGAAETVVYLVDHAQTRLMPVPGVGVAAREPLGVDGSPAGEAYRRVEVVRSATDGAVRIWLPLLDGSERMGVLELAFPDPATVPGEEEAKAFAALVAELAVSRAQYSDVLGRLRRARPLTLAAEIQWELLPPLSFATERVVISGVLEPAYEIGGDTFDYAVNGDAAEVLVLDAVGHGLPAALLSAAALGAYRHARRHEHPLPAISAAMNELIGDNFRQSHFATGVLARLDLQTGEFRWVNAGHPAPLIIRNGALVPLPDCRSSLPFGLQSGPAHECRVDLHAGDRVLLYTDGIVEARSPSGEFFGEARLADFVVRAEEAGDPPPETLRRLMRNVLDHQAGALQDDASIVLLEWRSGRDQSLEF
jgi:serine phosphatase RsbU (regulator of sigma subunit)